MNRPVRETAVTIHFRALSNAAKELPRLLVILLLTLPFISLRLIHLDADQPETIWSENVGEFIDEGSKVLDARNIALFGSPRISAEDDNPGWIHRSPITQWILVGAFRVFSSSLAIARLVSIAFFAFFILAFLLGPARDYRMQTVVLGLLLFGVTHQIFLFSRTAVFEMPLIFAVYLPVFLLRSRLGDDLLVVAGCLLAFAVMATFGIKASGLLYLGLASIGLALAVAPGLNRVQYKWIGATLAAVLLALSLIYLNLGESGKIFSPSVQLEPLEVFRSLVENPLFRASPVLVAAGLFCLLHWIVVDPNQLFRSRYRSALAAMAIGGPISMAFLTPSHLRYHVPVLPAYVLLTLDWLDSRSWLARPIKMKSFISIPAGLSLVALWLVCLTHGLNRFVVGPIVQGEPGTPALTGPISLTFVVLASGVGSLVAWRYRCNLFGGQTPRLVVIGMVTAAVVINASLDLSFLLSPTYQRKTIAAELDRRMLPGQVLAGDWSPYFTIDTHLKALWVSERFSVNTFSRLPETRPDYILFVETRDEELFNALPELSSIALGDAIPLASYLDRQMLLYPVRYADS